MTEIQCQVCHQQSFVGFPEHPPFSDYPYRSSSSIALNHSTHFNRHFAESARRGTSAPESCGSCHSANADGSMGVHGFEPCASCHLAEITDPSGTEPYLQVLAPPGLDLESLANAGIGDWPLFSEAEPDAFLRLMLDAGGYLDPKDLEVVFDLDLLDLEDASEEDRAAVSRFAWAFKELTGDILQDGPAAFVAIAQELHAGRRNLDWSSLAASLPYDVVAEASRQWFPALDTEIAAYGSVELPTNMLEGDFEEVDGFANLDDWLQFGGWAYRELALVYRPTGHADRFFHGWLEFASAPEPAAAALFDALTEDGAPGDCAKCHVSRTAAPDATGAGSDGTAVLRWFALGSDPGTAGPATTGSNPGIPDAMGPATADWSEFSRRDSPGPWHLREFSHWSHRQMITTNGCGSCHKASENPDSVESTSGFSPLETATCAACHAEKTGLADCLSCHIYHFEDDDRRMLQQASTLDVLNARAAE